MEGKSIPEELLGRETGLLQIPRQPRKDKHPLRIVLHGDDEEVWQLPKEMSRRSGESPEWGFKCLVGHDDDERTMIISRASTTSTT